MIRVVIMVKFESETLVKIIWVCVIFLARLPRQFGTSVAFSTIYTVGSALMQQMYEIDGVALPKNS